MNSPLTGFTLPHLSQFDPPVAGEGSLDPMGLGAISEQLSNHLVPDLRARMNRFRLLTAIAVGSIVCEDVDSEISDDGVTTPQIAFEWIVLESFARSSNSALRGIPGMQKARAVVGRRDRLSANSYLKGPSVFGFHGVYKPLATALKIVTPKLTGDVRQVELVRAWERESGLAGFVEATAGTDGGRLRDDLRQALRKSLRSGRCEVAPTGRAVQTLAHALDPDTAGPLEKHLLREAFDIKPTLRTELAQLVMPSLDEGGLFESDVVALVLESASPRLREILDAIVAYETFARTVDACFKTLCYLSNAIAPTPLVLDNAAADATIMEAAARIPLLYNLVVDTLGAVVSTTEFGTRFADFSDHHTPTALAHLILDHHAMIQRSKPPLGKRPWFEPYKNGCLVRSGYGVSDRPSIDGPFIHPIRVNALRRFLRDTAQ